MSWFSRLWRRKETIDITNPQHAMLFFGAASKSGARVTAETALQVATVIACLRAISEDVAKLPLDVVEVDEERGFTPTPPTDPLVKVLRKPQPWLSGRDLREAMTVVCALEGNAYSRILRDARGAINELAWMNPAYVTLREQDDPREEDFGAPLYRYHPPKQQPIDLRYTDVLHLKGWGRTPWAGLVPFHTARDAIGLTMATEESQARLQANGVRPSGLLSLDATLGDEAAAKLRKAFEEQHGGSDKQGKTLILDRNAKWSPMAMTGVDAQQIETRKLQIEEVCRVFRVLPLMVMQTDKAATFASAEVMFAQHVSMTISPYCDRWENELELKGATRPTTRVRHNMRALLRPSAKDRASFYSAMVTNGIMSRNEVRVEEGLDRRPGLDDPEVAANIGGAQPPSDDENEDGERDNVTPIRKGASDGTIRASV